MVTDLNFVAANAKLLSLSFALALTHLDLSTGFPKVPSLVLKIKANADHAGLSVLLDPPKAPFS